MKDFLLWKNAKIWFYAMSIASTWIWAPAIFVSSEKAYFQGLSGFLMFLFPNIFTLILFAFFANLVRNKIDGYTLTDAINKSDKRQKYLHLLVSIIILICSTAVQILGLHAIFSSWFEIPKFISALIVSILALLMVGKTGIKGSIQTDTVKYIIMLVCGTILFSFVYINNPAPRFSGILNISSMDIWKSFGISTMIGLLCAPYVDQTFWQRVFSINKGDIIKTFSLSAIFFALIPLIFGLIGFFQSSNNSNWNIGLVFNGSILSILLAFCVLAALLSTLDSNLCAISSICIKDFNWSFLMGKFSMIGLLILGSLITIYCNLTITELFLIYGTIRTCIAGPTILIILNKYNKARLFYATLIAILIAPIGYILVTDSKYIYTILALLIPLLGYSNSKNYDIKNFERF